MTDLASHADEHAGRARRTERLVERLATDLTPDERREVQDELAECNLPVARAVATRYRDRGIPRDDLEQVASLALVKAVRRFDPTAGHDFLSFCVPTVRGEVRRHFRDHGWAVRPTRRIQDLQRMIAAVEPELVERHDRRPDDAELAACLGRPEEEVRRGTLPCAALHPGLPRPAAEPVSSATLGDLWATPTPSSDRAEARVALGRWCTGSRRATGTS